MKERLNSVKTKGFALAEQKRAKASQLGSLGFEKKRKSAEPCSVGKTHPAFDV